MGGYKLNKYIKYRKEGINIVRLDQELQDLNRQRDKLMSLHSMITDIDICNHKEHTYKIFNISWIDDITGERQDYDLFIADSKNANAKALRTLAEIEIQEMKPKLNEDIDRFKLRSKMMTPKQKEIVADVKQDVKGDDGIDIHFMI